MRAVAADTARGCFWIATWGGLLSFFPALNLCRHHTSEHGLSGNAVRHVVVDASGVVWASDQYRGLCMLPPGDDARWTTHQDLSSWTVLCLAPAPGGGVFVALCNEDGGVSALGKVAPLPDGQFRLLPCHGLAVRDVETLLVDDDGRTLWAGNAWGLHRCQENGLTQTFAAEGARVRALARGVGGGLWLGTTQGLYHLNPREAKPRQDENWPLDEVVCLASEPVSGDLWVATVREVGRVTEGVWQASSLAPQEVVALLSVGADDGNRAGAQPLMRVNRVWSLNADGLYDTGVNDYEEILKPGGNGLEASGVQCLAAWGDEIFAGMAQGLYRFKAKLWRACEISGAASSDVRTLVADDNAGQLWGGTWEGKLFSLPSDALAHIAPLGEPLVALAGGAGGVHWAATLDAIYLRDRAGEQWNPLANAAKNFIDGRVIQSLCYRSNSGAGTARPAPVLWVGTSRGLYFYDPDLDLWRWIEGTLARLSIQCLALDPRTGQLWVGTSSGLFCEHEWCLQREGDIRSLAFDPAPVGALWVGTANGLERWSRRGDGEMSAQSSPQLTRFTTSNSGLGSDIITALCVSEKGAHEGVVWVGTTAGVGVYRAQPEPVIEA
jgi:ligand-binding sensor domain-containing protein